MRESRAAKLILVSGWTGAGKSTIADDLARDIGATVASFDWLMSGLRAFPDLWADIETPSERQREVGWSLLSRVAEQQLRRGASCILDVVARNTPREAWQRLASNWGAQFHVIECICSDPALHRRLVEGRQRTIPGWYELSIADAEHVRTTYIPLPEPKLVLDAVNMLEANLTEARRFIGIAGPPDAQTTRVNSSVVTTRAPVAANIALWSAMMPDAVGRPPVLCPSDTTVTLSPCSIAPATVDFTQ
jgi:predicted kinase